MAQLILAPASLDKNLGWEAYNDSTILAGVSQSPRQPATPEAKGAVHNTGTKVTNALSFKLAQAPAGTVVETLKMWAYVGALPGNLEWRWWWGEEELEHTVEYTPVGAVGWTSLAVPSPTFAATQTLNVVFHVNDESHGAQVWDTYAVVNEEATATRSMLAMMV